MVNHYSMLKATFGTNLFCSNKIQITGDTLKYVLPFTVIKFYQLIFFE